MSTPPQPGQPGPQPYQNPQIPGQPPAQPPTGGGYGSPVPAQHNPYAQTSPGFGPPQPGYYGAPQQPGAPGMPPVPGPGGTGGGQSRAGKAVLWAVVGAAVASALWAGGVFLLGKDSSSAPGLRGYKPVKDLCATADLSAFKEKYPKDDDDPTTYTSDRPALVQMYCGEGLDQEDTSASTGYVSVEADLHRKADPGPEFEDRWRSFGDHGSDPDTNYKVTSVDGFGDEAYLITQDTVPKSSDSGSSDSGDRTVVLAVRDGGLTVTLSWDIYSVEASDDEPSLDQGTEWVKAATKATMANLKK
ncbi:hypothetical protein [Streptomyces sp. NRRL F-5123]|uniref:hypothetical protein n=1 Tax=Streptomyces sp. NRRL F-5123 TaxID=1463856 RepID=UPI000693769B|nr:hypothetical protein [Streptomyces sp. NRRL F-5123]